jgi:hypothetical protein
MAFPQQNNFEQFQEDTFSIALRLENDGTADINASNPGYVSPTFDPALIRLQELIGQNIVQNDPRRNSRLAEEKRLAFYAAGRNINVPLGEVVFLEFTFNTLDLTGNRERAIAPITFNACYPYITTFIKNVCIDRDFYNTEATKTCIGSTVTDASQGAPVAVTQVEPRFNKQGPDIYPQFRIHLENLAGGFVLYSPTEQRSSEICKLTDFRKEEFGKVRVTALLNNVPLNCGTDGSGIARFERNSADIICKFTQPLQVGANYESPLVVQLHYFYISSLTAQVEVTK